ncbi:MAG: lysophospholipid acyltransferase family protein [Myxococcota bacterium]
MPRWLRIVFTGLSFGMFFAGSMAFGLLFAPFLLLLSLGNRRMVRDFCTRFVGWGYGTFLLWMKLTGLIGYTRVPFPKELEGKAYVLVANHPTLIDVLFLLHWFPGLTSVAKAAAYRSIILGPLLRSTHYLPGAGMKGDDEPTDSHMPRALERMVAHLEAGYPLVVFPEGTRSKATHLNRFRRGAFEAAVRAEVPLVRVFIRCDPLTLMKGRPFWDVPKSRAMYRFERLPIIDPRVDGRSGAELHRDVYTDFKERFEEWQRGQEKSPAALPSPVPEERAVEGSPT